MPGLSIYEIFGSNLGNPQICSLTRNQPSYLKNKYPENILKFYRNFGNHNLHLFSFIMTNDTNYGIWNHKNLFYNPSPTYRVLPLQIWESKNKNYSSDGLRKSKQKCVNLGVKCWILGKKNPVLDVCQHMEANEARNQIWQERSNKRCGSDMLFGCRSFLNCLFKRFSIYSILQSSSKCLALRWKYYRNYQIRAVHWTWCCKE